MTSPPTGGGANSGIMTILDGSIFVLVLVKAAIVIYSNTNLSLKLAYCKQIRIYGNINI